MWIRGGAADRSVAAVAEVCGQAGWVELLPDGDERRQPRIDVVLAVVVGGIGVEVDAAHEAQAAAVGAAQGDDGLRERDGIPDGPRQVQLVVVVEQQDRQVVRVQWRRACPDSRSIDGRASSSKSTSTGDAVSARQRLQVSGSAVVR